MNSSSSQADGTSPSKLALLETGRQQALDRLTKAGENAGVGALLLIGSLGRGGGDAWSDLDLIAVPGDQYTGLDVAELFGAQVLATVQAPRNAPIGGDYLGVCLEVSGLPLWVDWYQWPRVTAAVPSDGTPIFDSVGLPASDLSFIPLIQGHSDPCAHAHTDTAVATLLRVAVAAKYLARGDQTRLRAKIPGTQGLSINDAAVLLRQHVDELGRPDLVAAKAATLGLVDLAEAVAIGA
jgi:hypothetical protein